MKVRTFFLLTATPEHDNRQMPCHPVVALSHSPVKEAYASGGVNSQYTELVTYFVTGEHPFIASGTHKLSPIG